MATPVVRLGTRGSLVREVHTNLVVLGCATITNEHMRWIRSGKPTAMPHSRTMNSGGVAGAMDTPVLNANHFRWNM